VSLTGGFNDIHEILGGKPLKTATDDFESLQNITGPAKVQEIASMYPASLNTLDAIYIHLVAFETGNFMSTVGEEVAKEARWNQSTFVGRVATPTVRDAVELHEEDASINRVVCHSRQ